MRNSGVVRWLASVGVNGFDRRQALDPRTCSYPVPLASAAEQLYLAGRRAGLGRHDDSTVIEVFRGAPLTPT